MIIFQAMAQLDPSSIIELIYAFRRSQTMFTAVQLGVFDRLKGGSAPASEFPGDGGAVERLLDSCVALGLLERDGGLYRNSELANQYLVRSSPRTFAGYIEYSNLALYPMWGKLNEAVLEGGNRWHGVFGFESNELFDHFFRDDDSKRNFIAGMHGFGMVSSPAVAAAFDLSRFHRLVDLGGATGHLADHIVQQYPSIHGAVFDLGPVIEVARGYTGDRLALIAGDFFKDPLPLADLYALGRILHDWSELKIRLLLAKIYRALPAGGALLIAETLLDDDKKGPIDSLMQSLNMLVVTEGKERTLAEYESLLREAGFSQVEGRRTGTPLDAILAQKL